MSPLGSLSSTAARQYHDRLFDLSCEIHLLQTVRSKHPETKPLHAINIRSRSRGWRCGCAGCSASQHGQRSHRPAEPSGAPAAPYPSPASPCPAAAARPLAHDSAVQAIPPLSDAQHGGGQTRIRRRYRWDTLCPGNSVEFFLLRTPITCAIYKSVADATYLGIAGLGLCIHESCLQCINSRFFFTQLPLKALLGFFKFLSCFLQALLQNLNLLLCKGVQN